MKTTLVVGLLGLGVAATLYLMWPVPNALPANSPDVMVPSQDSATTSDVTSVDPGPTDSDASRSPRTSRIDDVPPGASAPLRSNRPVGVQPLTMEQERRLEDFVDAVARQSAPVRDLETLAEKEAPDSDWSAETERLLADAIRRHGDRLDALHAGPPYCTRTLCRMVATGGFDTSAANADWQGLVSAIQREPWARARFDDMNTTVQGDPKGMLYVTYLIRRL